MQPLLHDLAIVVRAPAAVLSAPDGQILGEGIQGLLVSDVRVLSRSIVRVNGRQPESIGQRATGPSRARFTGVCRSVGDDLPDPTVRLVRTRQVLGDGVEDILVLISDAQAPVSTTVSLEVGSDFADVHELRSGSRRDEILATTIPEGLGFHGGQAGSTTVRCHPAADRTKAEAGVLEWDVDLTRGDEWVLRIEVRADTEDGAPFGTGTTPPWSRPEVASRDHRIEAVMSRGLDDLASLLLMDDQDCFLAAGTPWFLTMFGRDSLWAARMLLPLGTDLALGTLQALASRQGRNDVPETEEQPGKILHEVRRGDLVLGDIRLPPVYYGTIDATPLWITLLSEAWRWGADTERVAALLPNLLAALDWMYESGDASDGGFLKYADRAGHGLSNQGWKDSGDAVQFADGRLAEPPIALCEVQAYAHQAALGAAHLLDTFDLPGADRARAWASDLKQRFRTAFWVEDELGRYPAIALDRHGQPVDSLTSNIGHLLGTGLLDPDEAALVAVRVSSPELDSGLGLRSLTHRSPRFGLLSYHGGTVWPHDTAIVAAGLAREGFLETATTLALGLVEASPTFGYRLPELYGVEVDAAFAVAYPAACRPQAWAAAAPVAALVAALGVHVDVPAGILQVPHRVDPRLASLVVAGLVVGATTLSVQVDEQGVVDVSTSGSDIEVRRV